MYSKSIETLFNKQEEAMSSETKGRRHGCVIAFEGMRGHVSRAFLRTNEFVPKPDALGRPKASRL